MRKFYNYIVAIVMKTLYIIKRLVYDVSGRYDNALSTARPINKL
jgi:hypothetical protein